MLIGHQVQVTFGAEDGLSLADLWPPNCRAVIVGVNPAPKSVAAGHYYQGSDGRRALARLRAVGLLPPERGGFADDEAVQVGIGFTDIAKRPTARSSMLTRTELDEGRSRLRDELARRQVPLIICVFKPAAVALVGVSPAPGFQDSDFCGSRVFRMPSPYAPIAEVEAVLATLAAHLEEKPVEAP